MRLVKSAVMMDDRLLFFAIKDERKTTITSTGLPSRRIRGSGVVDPV
jgi:hypothetical protein